MKKKGFTLIEIMGVIVLISLVFLITIPTILNKVKKSQDTIDSSTLELLKSASKDYMDDHKDDYPEIEGNIFCIDINDLIEGDYIKEDIVTINNKSLISNYMKVSLTKDDSDKIKYDYEAVKICEERIFPPEYEKMKYIESTSLQYIDTEIIPTDDLKIQIQLMPLAQCGTGYLGAYINDNNDYRLLSNTNFLFDIVNLRNTFSKNTIDFFKIYNIEIGNNYIKIDNDIFESKKIKDININKSIYLFRVDGLGGCDARIYNMKMYYGEKEVRNFIPSLEKKTKTLGLYDMVTKKFFINKGSLNFVSDKVDYEPNLNYIDNNQDFTNYTELEYIESKGRPLIDTGVYPTGDINLKVGIVPKVITGGYFIGNSFKDNNDFRIFNFNSNIYFDFTNARLIGSQMLVDNYYDIEIGNNYVKSNNELVLNGTKLNHVYTKNPIYVFGDACQIYYLKIYRGEKLIRDYIPAKRKSDGMIGLYDKLENKFYRSSNGNDFLYMEK